jgi:hypothetical protein
MVKSLTPVIIRSLLLTYFGRSYRTRAAQYLHVAVGTIDHWTQGTRPLHPKYLNQILAREEKRREEVRTWERIELARAEAKIRQKAEFSQNKITELKILAAAYKKGLNVENILLEEEPPILPTRPYVPRIRHKTRE